MKYIFSIIFFAMVLLPMSGCNILTPVAILFAPDAKTEALYDLQDRPTVVFVDDRSNTVSPASLRRVIAEKISQDLMVKDILTITISPRDAEAVARQSDTHNNVLPIDAIGRAVGAEQIIYVEMIEFRERVDQYSTRPRAVCRVRVIDVANRVRLFPDPSAMEPAHTIQVVMGEMPAELYNSRGTRFKIAEMLAKEIGDQAAKLFYKYSTSKLGKSLDRP